MNRKAFLLRISKRLHENLQKDARRNALSLNQYCERVLAGGGASLTENLGRVDWEAIAQAVGVRLLGVLLFGSRARGTARDSSDQDILFVVGPETSIRRTLYRELEERIGDPNVSVHIVHMPRDLESLGSLWLEVGVDGVVAFDPHGEMASLLSSIRRKIAEGFYRRMLTHGHGYWVRTDAKR